MCIRDRANCESEKATLENSSLESNRFPWPDNLSRFLEEAHSITCSRSDNN